MKCNFCQSETNMTVRNNKGRLFNCCQQCKTSINEKAKAKTGKISLWISCIWKNETAKEIS